MGLFNDLHVLVLGLGQSGLAMARWCARQGARVTVADTREQPPQLAALRGRGAKVLMYHGVSDPIFSADDTKALM